MKHWLLYILLILLSAGTVKAEILKDDTTKVEIREFDSERISELKKNPRYDYKVKESFIQKIWNRILEFIAKLLGQQAEKAARMSGGGEIFNALIAIIAIVLIIFGLSKVKYRSWVTGKGAKVEQTYEVEEENIHEIPFDKEIREAESEGDYRRAIRLYFLKVLKNLSDSEYIYWDPNKTNYQYMYEVKGTGIYTGFTKCVHIFELVWYGEHPADIHYYNEHKKYFRELADERIKTKTAVFNG